MCEGRAFRCSAGHTLGDGNMKELWDFNRSSAKSYLFFLIYFHVIALGVSLGQKTSEINQLETRSEINKYFPALVLENAQGALRLNHENQRA